MKEIIRALNELKYDDLFSLLELTSIMAIGPEVLEFGEGISWLTFRRLVLNYLSNFAGG